MVTLQSDWLLLHYKLPAEPSAPRVYIWRKLKRLGALLALDSIWVLPGTPRTLEQFQWLAAEIIEMGGQVLLWHAQPGLDGQDEDFRQQFLAQADKGYGALLRNLQKTEPDLEQLSRQYQQVKSRDYFSSELGVRARAALIARLGETA